MDTNTSTLQSIRNTTEAILSAMGGGSNNYLTTDGTQTVSNKTLDATNTYTLNNYNNEFLLLNYNTTADSTVRQLFITQPNLVGESKRIFLLTDREEESVNNKHLRSRNRIWDGTLLSKSGNTITFPDTTCTLATDDTHLYELTAALDSSVIGIVTSTFYIRIHKVSVESYTLELIASLCLLSTVDYDTSLGEDIIPANTISYQASMAQSFFNEDYKLTFSGNSETAIRLKGSNVSSDKVVNFHGFFKDITSISIPDTYKIY